MRPFVIAAGLFAGMLAIALPDYLEARRRSMQKRTMAAMHAVAESIEKRQPYGPVRDAWGHPLRVHVTGKHYAIRAANADGRFETTTPVTAVRTTGFDADAVLIDGVFYQFPEGLCATDVPGKGVLGDCLSCHPHRIQKR